ncbi:hypothetical protein WICPIJ_005215 [Wickerhamomyces pijperi]|uniref:Uncharacterized protein n=1 Tax=Wickerhamomyces pijperi TaxID=599730 RepID=A0A9P8TML0_WICPI|nr:hypothetical protein WICPIJ_005215 [Wickerhamomyces pijperi]
MPANQPRPAPVFSIIIVPENLRGRVEGPQSQGIWVSKYYVYLPRNVSIKDAYKMDLGFYSEFGRSMKEALRHYKHVKELKNFSHINIDLAIDMNSIGTYDTMNFYGTLYRKFFKDKRHKVRILKASRVRALCPKTGESLLQSNLNLSLSKDNTVGIFDNITAIDTALDSGSTPYVTLSGLWLKNRGNGYTRALPFLQEPCFDDIRSKIFSDKNENLLAIEIVLEGFKPGVVEGFDTNNRAVGVTFRKSDDDFRRAILNRAGSKIEAAFNENHQAFDNALKDIMNNSSFKMETKIPIPVMDRLLNVKSKSKRLVESISAYYELLYHVTTKGSYNLKLQHVFTSSKKNSDYKTLQRTSNTVTSGSLTKRNNYTNGALRRLLLNLSSESPKAPKQAIINIFSKFDKVKDVKCPNSLVSHFTSIFERLEYKPSIFGLTKRNWGLREAMFIKKFHNEDIIRGLSERPKHTLKPYCLNGSNLKPKPRVCVINRQDLGKPKNFISSSLRNVVTDSSDEEDVDQQYKMKLN